METAMTNIFNENSDQSENNQLEQSPKKVCAKNTDVVGLITDNNNTTDNIIIYYLKIIHSKYSLKPSISQETKQGLFNHLR